MTAHTRLYQAGKVIDEGFGADDAAARLRDHPDAVLWLDLLDPDMDGLDSVREEFGLHPLAVEDAVEDHQRPKLDHYPGHLFMNMYAVRVDTDGPVPAVAKTEISAFVTERALITVHKSPGDLDRLTRRWDDDDGLAADGGVSFLVYGLLDVIVDGQFAAARQLDEAMDDAEDRMLEEGAAPRDVRKYGFAVRRSAALLRRAVAPMPDLVAALLRTDAHVVPPALKPYFRDVDDQARRADETIETARDRITSVLEADLNERSNELNDVARKLAAWAAIIAVPTALTGFFGQNVPYPGYESTAGFLASTALIVLTAGALYWYLKHRGWL